MLLAPLVATVSAVVGLDLTRLPTDSELSTLLWERAPELQLARARVASAKADYDRANLLPNPGLDVSASSLPIGPQNPTAPVTSPGLEVPNYAFAISELIELGKRGPRQESTRRTFDAALWDAREQLRQRFFDLKDHLGEIAGAQARIAALTSLAGDAARLAVLQRARADKGDASSLDADRALLDQEKLESNLGAEREHLLAELRACAEVSGGRCDGFVDADAAQSFLSAEAPSPGDVLNRPDVQSLQASEDASRAAATLAERRAIPDPTLRVGYVRDQYIASGNWPNSLFVGVSIPLPVFDHGQADARAAAAAADAAQRARERTVDTARAQLERVSKQLEGIEARRAQLRDRTLPLARDVVSRLDAAVVRGAAAIQDVITARRTLTELLLDSNDLDLDAFHSRVARSRLSGGVPPLPEELKP